MTNTTQKVLVRSALSAAIALLLTPNAVGQTNPVFTSSARDLTFNAREINGGTAGPSNLVVDLGAASSFFSSSTAVKIGGTPGPGPGGEVNLDLFRSADLLTLFGGDLDHVLWSVTSATRAGDGGDSSIPNSTLWVTAPRSDAGTPANPWTSRSTFSQGSTANRIDSIRTGAGTVGTALTAHEVLVLDSSPLSYHSYVTDVGNLGGTFQGNIENDTGSGFAGSAVAVSDLYELRPSSSGTPAGTYLGSFELQANGDLVFTPVPEPTVLSLSLVGLLGLAWARSRRPTRA